MAIYRELAIDLILDGVEPEAALRAASSESALSVRLTKFSVEPGGPLTKIPNPACVAKHLRGIANPTRDDIARALRACTQ